MPAFAPVGERLAAKVHGWRKEAGRSGGGAGYNTDPDAGRRERIWFSPTSLGNADLFTHLDEVTA